MTRRLTVGSLFAGIGGFDLAAERAGMEVRWQVEIDDYATRVLEKHWPNVRRGRDVRELHAAQIDPESGMYRPICQHCVEPVDVICGGFPCQDISSAGKGAGIDGERSGLWREYARIVGELRPRYVVVENVSALLARGLNRVLGDLAEIGYDAEWDCIPASAVGAPHRRDRVWLVAYPARLGYQRAGAAWGRRHGLADGGPEVADANSEGLEGRQRAIVPECASERTTREGGASMADASRLQQGRTEQRPELERTRPSRQSVFPYTHGRRQQERQELDSQPHEGAADRNTCGRHIDGCRCAAWWESEPDVGRVADGVPARVDRLRGLGNAIVPQVAEWIFRRIQEAEAVNA